MNKSNAAPHWDTVKDVPHNRRVAERLALAERVAIATPWGDIDGTLVDISATGAQVRVVNGLVPFAGDDATLRLVGAGQHAGRIAWTAEETIGLVFEVTIDNVEELLWIEQRGPEWYGRAGSRRCGTTVWG